MQSNNDNNGSKRGGRLGYDEMTQKATTRSRLLSFSNNTQLMMMTTTTDFLPPPS